MLEEDVLEFLRSVVGSFWALEQLLLLHRDPSRRWSAAELTRELRSTGEIVAGVLAQLRTTGLVEADKDSYRYRPATPEIDALVGRLADAYAKYPYAVTHAILSAPNQKIQLFADAFRLKRE